MALALNIARRGRPKSSSLPDLIREGESKNGLYKCEVCNRDFPRNKSLMAHGRTHTGETPYICSYPDCCRAFKQSGQLKTHEKRHTGEKPFACPIDGCAQRFIHSSRQCPKHPGLKLKKDGFERIHYPENLAEEELKWLQNYEENKDKPVKKRKISVSEHAKVSNYTTEFGTVSGAIQEDASSSASSSTSGISVDNCYSADDSSEDVPKETVQVSNESQRMNFNCNNFYMDHPAFEAALVLCSFTKQTFNVDNVPKTEMNMPYGVCR